MDPQLESACKGIRNPHMTSVRPGKLICRFAENEAQALDSPWWIYQDTLEDLRRRVNSDPYTKGTGLKFMARIKLAVCGDWSNMSVLVVAQANAELLAYAGQGQRIQDKLPNGMTWTFQPPKDLVQLYIPGLHGTLKKNVFTPGADRGNIIKISAEQLPPSNISYWDRGSKKGK